LAQLQNPRSPVGWQADLPRLSTRKCLREGCNRYFSPNHPLDRYCGDDCNAAVRRWQLARANLKYRGSEQGKENRHAQAARYRIRLKERQAAEISLSQSPPHGPADDPTEPREGYHKDDAHKKSCCDRPGCYRRFTPPPRSPLQKFCSFSCHNALRTVLRREQRWLQRLAIGLKRPREGPL
jgi:hypothetical protein